MRQRTGLLVLAAFLCLAVFSSAVLADSNANVRARARRAPATNSTAPPAKASPKATPKAKSNVTKTNSTAPKPVPPKSNVTANGTKPSNQTSTTPVRPSNSSSNATSNKSANDGYPFPNSTWFNSISRVQIARVLEASAVITDALFAVNHTVNGLLKVNGSLEALSVVAMSTRTKILETKSIRSPTGTVVVDGDLQIVNSKGATEAAARRAGKVGSFGLKATAFLAEEVVVSGVKQWRLVRHDSFEQEVPGQNPADGWSMMELSSCSRNAARDQSEVDHFLGGHCNIAAGELKKRFDHLPPHKHVRLSARYHMIDNWQGETAFLKIGEEYVWSDRSRASADSEGLDTCGSEKYAERRMSVPIDVVIPHSASFLEVSFGSTALSKNKGKESPCDRSFGVDDVMVYVR